MKWNETEIRKVSLSITNYCNAACPQCDRTDVNGLGVVDWLPMTQWTLEDFKKAFPRFDTIKTFEFSGTWGDPLMMKDLVPICEYILSAPDTNVEIFTNGSLRSEDWWWEFGVKFGNRLTVTFDVDGTTQEMHSFYRRKTILMKVLGNLHTLAQTPANVYVQTIVFAHNRDYLEDIESLVYELGAQHWFATPSTDRFNGEGEFHFTDENGKEQVLCK